MYGQFPHQEELYATHIENNLVVQINKASDDKGDPRGLKYGLATRGYTYNATLNTVTATPFSSMNLRPSEAMTVLPSWPVGNPETAAEPQGLNRVAKPVNDPLDNKGSRSYPGSK